MSNLVEILVPDIGNFESVDVIEVLVKAGDTIDIDDSLITAESDKASMDIPASQAGTVKEIKVKIGDKIAKGSLILLLEAASTATVQASVPGTRSRHTHPRIPQHAGFSARCHRRCLASAAPRSPSHGHAAQSTRCR